MYQILIDCHDGAKVALSLSLSAAKSCLVSEGIDWSITCQCEENVVLLPQPNRKDVKDLPTREVVGWVEGFVEIWFG